MSEKTDTTGGGVEFERAGVERLPGGTKTTSVKESVSLAVVEALAEAKGVSSLDLEEPLYETIDPEALDTLFSPADDPSVGQVVFEIDDFEVTVTSDGAVSVHPID